MIAPALDIPHFLAFGLPSGWEWIIVLLIGLLLFGRRLPEVGRSLGRGIVEFKRGIKGIDDEIEDESSRPDQLESKPAPKPQAVARSAEHEKVSAEKSESGDEDRRES